ncbi:chromosome segregation protein SMC, partial [Ameyamaea chiangmaiensis]|nr:chromosome segregation protein SMC [Ameyamaea chiangmaiensis]
EHADRALREAEHAVEACRSEATATRTARVERLSRIEALAPGQAAVALELGEIDTLLGALDADAAALPDLGTLDAGIDALQGSIATIRADENRAREGLEALTAEQASLNARETTLSGAVVEWAERLAAGVTDLAALQGRTDSARVEHARVAALPDAAQRHRDETVSALEEAEARWKASDEARQAAEARLVQAQIDRRDAETALAQAREEVVRSEGRSDQARAVLDALLAESPPPPGITPTDLTESAESSLRRKISRLTREREDLGPVNLRAELEADTARERMDVIVRERGDLESAIAKLRGSIGALNREGRERLMAVFTEIDRHFQALFSRMFGGGKAHLAMVGDDDPLMAGLEIYAQPPGKKLATLSLLSGGEQALTALSLIFAVFRCNPAPVCVLDEVDAPLDDANVGRFCSLLGDMVAEAGTRFLVVTHHQLTMAHMDRLYGVTMQERGVSRVLSVDLGVAAELAGHARLETSDVLT